MKDSEIIAVFRPVLLAQLQARGYSTIKVLQMMQPKQQGATTVPTIYFQRIGQGRRGWQDRKTIKTTGTAGDPMAHTERQWFETMFQFNALAPNYPDGSGSAAGDLIDIAHMVWQSDIMRKALASAGLGMYRPSDIRQNWFVDDQDRNEADPSFDVVITNRKALTSQTPSVKSINPDIYRV